MPYMRFVVFFIVMLNCLRHCRLAESFKLRRINGRTSKAFISSNGLRRFQSTAVETAPSAVDLGGSNKTLSVTSPVSTKDMNLVNLKALVKTLGGTPGSLRKAELLDLCDSLLLQKEADKSSPEPSNEAPTKADVLSDVGVEFDTVIAACKAAEPTKQKIRAMAPILPGPQSMDQFQLPVIKGNVNQIGSNIVKDLGDMYATKKSSADEERSSDFDSVGTVQKDDLYAPKKEQIRSYIMGGVYNTSDSMEYLNITSGAHYWAYHPSGIYRDDRIIEGYQRDVGLAASGPGSGLGDMDITFLGTASCVPSLTRGVSCVAFRYNSDVWLVDCGEGSQQQMQKSRIKPSKITKIFITHLHGDHSFGIPGVLCLIGQATMAEREKEKVTKGRLDRSDPRRLLEEDTVLDIYGPEGTRDYIRAAIQLTHSKVVHPYRVHELKDVPNLYVRPPKLPPPLPVVRN
jgi:hypothetical protein